MRKVKSFIFIILLILICQLIANADIIPRYLFPSPYDIAIESFKMITSFELFFQILVSLRRVIIGFLISCILGIIFGSMSSLCTKVEDYYISFIDFLRHIPPISLIPLLILWFGIGEMSKIIIIVLTAFSPIFINTSEGLKSLDNKLYEVGTVCKMSTFEKFIKIRVPYAIPQIISGMKIGLGYSFRAIVGAEMIAAASGIGYLIINSQTLFRIDKVFIGVITIGIVGIAIDYIFDKITKFIFKKYYYK